MLRTSFITCALVAVAGSAAAQPQTAEPAAAQQTAPAQQPSPQPVIVEGNLKSMVRLYEIALSEAINKAGTNLVTWARGQVGPGFTVNMVPAAWPKVSAILLPDNSLAFDIHLAEMNVTAYEIAMGMRRLQSQQAQQRPPDKSTEKVSATGLVPADPVTPPVPGTGGPVSPSQAYSDFVREALLDALVEQGHVLPIGRDRC